MENDLERALELADKILLQAPDSIEGRIIAGYAASGLHQIDAAFNHYSQIPDDDNPRSLEGRCLLAQLLLFDMGRAEDAEKCYRRVLQHDPDHGLAHQGLASLLEIEGRRWELLPQMLHAIRAGRCDVSNLLAIGWVQLPSGNAAVLKKCRSVVPEDPLPLLGLARIAFRENRLEEATKLLHALLDVRPDQLEAQALLGRLLTEANDSRAWINWHSQLPESANELPDIWFVRGLWAERMDNLPGAARCFAECCQRDPDHFESNFRLSQVLLQVGPADRAMPFLIRSRHLELLGQQMNLLHSRPTDTEVSIQVARTLETLGRYWEAWGWYQASKIAGADTTQDTLRMEREHLNWVLQRTQPQANAAFSLDLTSLPMPTFQTVKSLPVQRSLAGASHIRFDEETSKLGISFQYFNGREPGATGVSLAESAGGGVAVIDFDGDSWPDLFLSQGSHLQRRAETSEPTDKLFRNLDGEKFEDVTEAAHLVEWEFGQGATVGDFNDDGFPDLYIANVGINRLYQNNGDGTFADVSANRHPREPYWTSSVVMADFNGDGFPDLFDCTYVTGEDAATRICTKQGIPRVCSPLNFNAERDRFFLNSGDGHFQEMGESVGIGVPPGKGLGVVAADFDGSGRLSLFVANDLEANSYFHNATPTRDSEPPVFIEQALLNGLAFDEGGRAQACMGVAAGDANGDGMLDLFTTNYYLESNTLYVGHKGGLFTDGTRKSGLRDPGYHMLGFGTQFLDFDLDGALDLVVTNGHLDDFTHENTPYRMAPQAFHNNGMGEFQELKSSSLGTYLQQKCLGRGLARLDWNRDGREEFAVSHLDQPFSLLTNRTVTPGRFLALVLHGKTGSRDAIGTTVTAVIDGKSVVRQLTAGDGYMASNQREVVFGLEDSAHIDKLDIKWPGGRLQSFEGVPSNQHYVLVEGHSLTTLAVPH